MRRPIVFYSRRAPQRPRISRVRLILTWTVFFTVVFGVFTLWWVDRQLSQPLKAWAELQVRNLGQRVATLAMQEVLAEHADGVQYLYPVSDGTTGTSVWRYDWSKLHHLSVQFTEKVLDHLERVVEERIYVPLGELLGLDVFAGTGPLIPVRIIPAGGVETELVFAFDSAGINVVRHHIEMVLVLHMRVIAPAIGREITVVEHFPLDTVLLEGPVPDVYLHWGSGSFDDFMRSGLANMLNRDIGSGTVQPHP